MLRSYEIKGVDVSNYPELKFETFWRIIKENPISHSYLKKKQGNKVIMVLNLFLIIGMRN